MINEPYIIDKRRRLIVPGNQEETIDFAVAHWIKQAQDAIEARNGFYVALSGGSTPKKIFQRLSSEEYRNKVPWSKVYLFWSDERVVPLDHPESNCRMALVEGRLGELPIPTTHIFPMHTDETDLENNALAYEKAINKIVPEGAFDLIMLGMGEDGHTASLFPHTKGLHETTRLVVANYVPQKNCSRLSFTFSLINQAKEISVYVIGADKGAVLEKIFTSPFNPEELPSQNIGSEVCPALWIADQAAGQRLLAHIND